MGLLEDKIDELALKVNKLLEQNAQYSQSMRKLLEEKRMLEAENAALKQQLAAVDSTASNNLSIDFDKEGLQKQIDKYIQDIDWSIQLLSSL